jgi:hypothetical protein
MMQRTMLSRIAAKFTLSAGLLHSVMVVLAASTMIFGAIVCLDAQTLSGSIVGTVGDPTGASVVGAVVTVTELQTNTTRTVDTNEGGLYTLSTLPPGIYKLTVSKTGFGGYTSPHIEVTSNTIARVDVSLKVGDQNVQVDVRTDTALLQTDRADVHTQLSASTFQNAPQPTRTYQGVLNLVPGMVPPGGQLAGGTNNPSKSMQFAANGTGTQGPNVRIEGVSATNPWVQQYTTFVPSTEAIESVNVVTNSPDAEQGLSGGPAVTVQLKSGTNQMHGSLYEQNVNNYTEARNFFQPAGQKPPHLVDNTVGGSIGGRLIKDKLFYFGSYEGSFTRASLAGIISVPTQAMLRGDMSASTTPIYDPVTGNSTTGIGKTQFPGNIIPASRINPVTAKLIPNIPAPNLPGTVNNYSVIQGTSYNLHKIDTKFDYVATQKLRISARYGYQPYNAVTNPLFGPILGGSSGAWAAFSSAGAGNYLQHGATLAVSASATYVATPTLVFDATFGVTQAHQLLSPVLADQKYGSDVLGIPGSNQGSLPLAGGMPNFAIANYGGSTGNGTFGYSYPPLEYKDPIFEYVGNVTKTYKSHNIRAGGDVIRLRVNHKEIRNTLFYFPGGLTARAPDPANNIAATPVREFNSVGDFLLGLPQYQTTWVQFDDFLTLRQYQLGFYLRDQWQASHNLTINYGVRWEHYPVPTRAGRGIEYNNMYTDVNNPTIQLCGVGGNAGDCGIKVSNKLFSPSVGVSYRPLQNFVIRAGVSISPMQVAMAQALVQNYPGEVQYTATGANAYTAAGNLTTGFPIQNAPTFNSNGTVNIPVGTANANTTEKNFRRGYVESYNLMLEKEFPGGFLASGGYVGTHVVNLGGSYNFNYGTLGGGAASQRLNTPALKITGTTNVFKPIVDSGYNSLQIAVSKRMQNGLSMKMAYTWSKNIQSGFPSGQIWIPEYKELNKSLAPVDRTHNFIVNATYELPFGAKRSYLNHGFVAAIVGGWSLNGTFYHLSGTPFSILADGSSCNCPGNTQRADRVKSSIAKTGRGVFGTTFFDPTAFAAVNTVKFGSANYNSLRGPGATNLDAAIQRQFHIWERTNLSLRLDSYNVTNTPHFANPNNNVSTTGFGTITALNPLGRQIDQRYFRLGGRISF